MKVFDMYVNDEGQVIDATGTVNLTGFTKVIRSPFAGNRYAIDFAAAPQSQKISSPSFIFGLNDFCIELDFFYGENANDYGCILDTGVLPISNNRRAFYVNKSNARMLEVLGYGANIYTSANLDNSVTNMAICRKSGYCKVFINGKLIGGFSDNDEYGTDSFTIGSSHEINQFVRNIQLLNMKIYNGEYKYDSNFIPETFLKTKPYAYVGDGSISGNVRIKGESMPFSELSLFSEDNSEFVSKTTADNSGNFTFTGLNKSKQFYIVAKPNEGNEAWEYRVSSRRIPK